MALTLATSVVSAMATGILTEIDSGGSAALLRIYDGTRPAGPGTAITTQTLLAEVTLDDPSFTESGGVLTLAGTPLSDLSANATGTATWARFVESGGAGKVDCSVGAGSGDINLNTTSIVSGGTFTITSGTITVPAS